MEYGMPKINAEGLTLIKDFEGSVLHVYPDPGTGGRPHTAGVGHTGREVDALAIGTVITQEQADVWLRRDLDRFEESVNRMVSHDLTPNQFSALVSFAFNVGEESLEGSTLLRMVNQGFYSTAANHFLDWVNAGGHPMPGLIRRREAEAALFLKK
jgi:lysozyme